MIDYYTVVPLANVQLPPGSCYELGGNVALIETPGWLIKDRMLDRLSEFDRREVQECKYALVASYKAAALGDPDPDWKGKEPKSIQETKYEHCVFGNLALWLCRPSPVHFRVVIHAPDYGSGALAQQVTYHSPLLCHPYDAQERLRAEDLPLASQLHRSILQAEQQGPIWTAVRAAWAALTINMEVVRYTLFWIVLEALFGPDDAHEITYRLSLRLARFLETDREQARSLFSVAKQCYKFRSKIVHGRWKDDPESTKRVAETETLVRRSLVRVLSDEEQMKTFSDRTREHFLDELVI